jgi:hypothetical protein
MIENTLERDTIAAQVDTLSRLMGLALSLLAECPYVNAKGHRVREMDQLDALLNVTAAQIAGMADRIEALQ